LQYERHAADFHIFDRRTASCEPTSEPPAPSCSQLKVAIFAIEWTYTYIDNFSDGSAQHAICSSDLTFTENLSEDTVQISEARNFASSNVKTLLKQ